MKHLFVMRLSGPLQYYPRGCERESGNFPSKSAVMGIVSRAADYTMAPPEEPRKFDLAYKEPPVWLKVDDFPLLKAMRESPMISIALQKGTRTLDVQTAGGCPSWVGSRNDERVMMSQSSQDFDLNAVYDRHFRIKGRTCGHAVLDESQRSSPDFRLFGILYDEGVRVARGEKIKLRYTTQSEISNALEAHDLGGFVQNIRVSFEGEEKEKVTGICFSVKIDDMEFDVRLRANSKQEIIKNDGKPGWKWGDIWSNKHGVPLDDDKKASVKTDITKIFLTLVTGGVSPSYGTKKSGMDGPFPFRLVSGADYIVMFAMDEEAAREATDIIRRPKRICTLGKSGLLPDTPFFLCDPIPMTDPVDFPAIFAGILDHTEYAGRSAIYEGEAEKHKLTETMCNNSSYVLNDVPYDWGPVTRDFGSRHAFGFRWYGKEDADA